MTYEPDQAPDEISATSGGLKEQLQDIVNRLSEEASRTRETRVSGVAKNFDPSRYVTRRLNQNIRATLESLNVRLSEQDVSLIVENIEKLFFTRFKRGNESVKPHGEQEEFVRMSRESYDKMKGQLRYLKKLIWTYDHCSESTLAPRDEPEYCEHSGVKLGE